MHPTWLANGCVLGANGRNQSVDLAIISLQSPVPPNVAQPLPVYLSSVAVPGAPTQPEFVVGGVGPFASYEIVGFGGNNVFNCGNPNQPACTGVGTRRHGPISPYLETDPCGDPWFLAPENGCWLNTIVLSDLFEGIDTAGGDSGGPIVGFPNVPSLPFVVAINEGSYNAPGVNLGIFGTILEQQINTHVYLADPVNSGFLLNNIPALQADADGDGVLDSIDNCTLADCSPGSINCNANNPGQEDIDQDGVGDSCDNCNPNRYCKTNPLACQNFKVDADGDGVFQQNDADGDRIGDLCDPFPQCNDASNNILKCTSCNLNQEAYCKLGGATGCPQPEQYTPVCSATVSCPPALGQQCLIDPGATQGRCARPADADLDGIADLCDDCLGYNNLAGPPWQDPPLFNPGLNQSTNPNSNRQAEVSAAVSSLADLCDPVPIQRLSYVRPSERVQIANPTNPSSPKTPSDAQVDLLRSVEPFSTQTVFGRRDPLDIRSLNGTYEFRGCQCNPNNVSECLIPGGICSTNAGLAPGWISVSIDTEAGTPVSGSLPATFSSLSPGALVGWSWNWQDDFNSGIFPAFPLTDQIPGTSGITRPYMPAGIRSDVSVPFYTATPREVLNNLRHTYAPILAGYVEQGSANINFPTAPTDCGYTGDCVTWGHWKWVTDPYRFWIPEEQIEIGFVDQGRFYSAKEKIRLEVGIPQELLEKLEDHENFRVIQPVESASSRNKSGDFRQFAILPTQFSTQARPTVTRMSLEGLAVEGRRVGAVAPLALAAEPPPSSPPSVQGYQALFSTSMNSLFLAGGKGGTIKNKQIWRYDLEDQSWRPALSYAFPMPSEDVLAMTLDPGRQWLYVLYVEDVLRVRLVRYDLLKNKATTLMNLPYFKRFKGVYLNTLDDGTLVLTTTKEHQHTMFGFTVKNQGLQFLGVRHQVGAAIFPPQLDASGLIVPSWTKKNGLEYKSVSRSSFKWGLPCDGL